MQAIQQKIRKKIKGDWVVLKLNSYENRTIFIYL